MNFTESLFGGPSYNPPKEKWDRIIGKLHEGLLLDRRAFYDMCVSILAAQGCAIHSAQLDNGSEVVICVYQLHIAREVVAEIQYVPPSDGQDFVDRMYEGALKYGPLLVVHDLIHKLWPDKQGIYNLSFYSLVAAAITGKSEKLVLAEAMRLLSRTVSRLTFSARISTFIAFNDKKREKQLRDSYVEETY